MMKLKLSLYLFAMLTLGWFLPRGLSIVESSSGEAITLSIPNIKTPSLSSFDDQKSSPMSVPKIMNNESKLKEVLVRRYQVQLYKMMDKPSETQAPAKRLANKPKQREEVKTIWTPTWKTVEIDQELEIRDIVTDAGEINNSEFVSHYGFKVSHAEPLKWLSYYENANVSATLAMLEKQESQRIALAKEIKPVELKAHESSVLEDQVKTTQAQASQDKSDEESMDDETWEEELVMIDYSNESKKVEETSKDFQSHQKELSKREAFQLLASTSPGESVAPLSTQDEVVDTQPEILTPLEVNSMSDDLINEEQISDSVMRAIAREMGKGKASDNVEPATVNVQKPASPEVPVVTQSKQKVDYSSLTQSSVQKPEKAVAGYSSSRDSGYSQNTLRISSANIESDDSGRELRNFEFFAETLNTRRYVDDSTGLIELNFDLSSALSVLRGTIMKRGFMRTKVDMILEPGQYDLNIPLIEQDTFARFLDTENINGHGGYVLIRMPEHMRTAEVDSSYEAKIHLDESFQVVGSDEDFDYILFAGVKPGNTLLSYESYNSKVADKISHVVEDEVLYENGIIVEPAQMDFDLYTKKLLSQKDTYLDIDADKINYFNRSETALEQAVGSYSLTSPLRVLGMRDYVEFRHTNLPLFSGSWGSQKISLPSEEFAYYIMDSHSLTTLENSCLVQINLSKPIKSADFFGETKSGPMGLIQSFLDKDGSFSYDASEMSSQIFLIGDLQGLISGKIDYLDGSTQFLQTLCSDNTYLVEQL